MIPQNRYEAKRRDIYWFGIYDHKEKLWLQPLFKELFRALQIASLLNEELEDIKTAQEEQNRRFIGILAKAR